MDNAEMTIDSPIPKKKVSVTTTPIRVKKATARTIRSLVSKLNRKSLGGKVLVDDIVSKAISLLSEDHLEEIKASTYTSKDRLEIRYKEYCQEHGNITKEKFLEFLLDASFQDLKSKDQNEKE